MSEEKRGIAEHFDAAFERERVPTAEDKENARKALRSQALLAVMVYIATRTRSDTALKLLGMDFSHPEQGIQAAKLQGKAEGIVTFLESLADFLEEEENDDSQPE